MHIFSLIGAAILYGTVAQAAPQLTPAPSPTLTPTPNPTATSRPSAIGTCAVTRCSDIDRPFETVNCFELSGSSWNDTALDDYGTGLLDNLRGSIDYNIVDWAFDIPAPDRKYQFRAHWANKENMVGFVNWVISDLMGGPANLCSNPPPPEGAVAIEFSPVS